MTDVFEYTANCTRTQVVANLIRAGYRVIPGTNVYTKEDVALRTTVYVGPLSARYVQTMEVR